MTITETVNEETEQTVEDKRAQWIADARSLVDFIEANPLIIDSGASLGLYVWQWVRPSGMDVKDFVTEVAQALAPAEPVVESGKITWRREFGSHAVQLQADLKSICEYKLVPGMVEEWDLTPFKAAS